MLSFVLPCWKGRTCRPQEYSNQYKGELLSVAKLIFFAGLRWETCDVCNAQVLFTRCGGLFHPSKSLLDCHIWFMRFFLDISFPVPNQTLSLCLSVSLQIPQYHHKKVRKLSPNLPANPQVSVQASWEIKLIFVALILILNWVIQRYHYGTICLITVAISVTCMLKK